MTDAELEEAKAWAEKRIRVWENAGITLKSGRVICAGHLKWVKRLRILLAHIASAERVVKAADKFLTVSKLKVKYTKIDGREALILLESDEERGAGLQLYTELIRHREPTPHLKR